MRTNPGVSTLAAIAACVARAICGQVPAVEDDLHDRLHPLGYRRAFAEFSRSVGQNFS